MILEGQNRMQEALKKMQPPDHQPPLHNQTLNTPNFPTLITEESNHSIRTSQNFGHPSTQTTLPIPNPNYPPLSPIPVPISHPTSGFPHIPITYQPHHISTISYSISHPTQSHAISHPSPWLYPYRPIWITTSELWASRTEPKRILEAKNARHTHVLRREPWRMVTQGWKVF